MYSPLLGQFAQRDPLGYAAGDENLYRYVGNSPISSWDSSGTQQQAGAAITRDLNGALNAFRQEPAANVQNVIKQHALDMAGQALGTDADALKQNQQDVTTFIGEIKTLVADTQKAIKTIKGWITTAVGLFHNLNLGFLKGKFAKLLDNGNTRALANPSIAAAVQKYESLPPPLQGLAFNGNTASFSVGNVGGNGAMPANNGAMATVEITKVAQAGAGVVCHAKIKQTLFGGAQNKNADAMQLVGSAGFDAGATSLMNFDYKFIGGKPTPLPGTFTFKAPDATAWAKIDSTFSNKSITVNGSLWDEMDYKNNQATNKFGVTGSVGAGGATIAGLPVTFNALVGADVVQGQQPSYYVGADVGVRDAGLTALLNAITTSKMPEGFDLQAKYDNNGHGSIALVKKF